MDSFARRLLRWYDRHGRHDLPWQRDATPYHVWLSEIMLQQTQVSTVIPYYERFIEAFPTVQALADAQEDAVLHHWSGLGYYARARNLHAAARRVLREHGGRFPADLDALQALPGVGRSTAGAILSSALGGRAPILDGNVKRVLARFHGVEGWPGKTSVARELWELAEAHTPWERVADYTQAIMDLGATLCTRANPDCPRCPQRGDCRALRDGRQGELPARKPAKEKPTRQTTFLLALTPAGELLLEKRPATGIWGGLWCFPEVEGEPGALSFCDRQLAAPAAGVTALPRFRHTFSHYHLEITPLLLTLSRTPSLVREGSTLRAWDMQSPPAVGLPAPIARLWSSAVEGHRAALFAQGEKQP